MRTDASRVFGFRTALVACLLLPACVLAFAGGAIRYETEDDDFDFSAPEPAAATWTGDPVKVMVMPLSLTIDADRAEGPIRALAEDEVFLEDLWGILRFGVDSADHLEQVPMPEGAEADEIIQKTMHYFAGALPAEEFAKVKSFQLPERFLYGNVIVTTQVEEHLEGFRAVETVTYKADAHLRLVNGVTLTYTSVIGRGSGSRPEVAIRQAVSRGLDRVVPPEAATE